MYIVEFELQIPRFSPNYDSCFGGLSRARIVRKWVKRVFGDYSCISVTVLVSSFNVPFKIHLANLTDDTQPFRPSGFSGTISFNNVVFSLCENVFIVI